MGTVINVVGEAGRFFAAVTRTEAMIGAPGGPLIAVPIYTTPGHPDAYAAAQDAKQWCWRQGIYDYEGPVLSGHGSLSSLGSGAVMSGALLSGAVHSVHVSVCSGFLEAE